VDRAHRFYSAESGSARRLHGGYDTDPKNHDEAVAIVAGLNKAPAARMDWAFTSRDQYRNPNDTPNLGALQSNLRQQKEVGLLNDDIDVKKYADLTMVEEAAKRLQ
jgi:NitT/TauT family transport system substrate-binding protein